MSVSGHHMNDCLDMNSPLEVFCSATGLLATGLYNPTTTLSTALPSMAPSPTPSMSPMASPTMVPTDPPTMALFKYSIP